MLFNSLAELDLEEHQFETILGYDEAKLKKAALIGSSQAFCELKRKDDNATSIVTSMSIKLHFIEKTLRELLLQLDEINYKVCIKPSLLLHKKAIVILRRIEKAFLLRKKVIEDVTANKVKSIAFNNQRESLLKQRHFGLAKFVGKYLFGDRRYEFEKRRTNLSSSCTKYYNKFDFKEVNIVTDDYVTLTCMVVTYKEEYTFARNYILYTPKCGRHYADEMEHICALAQATKANICCIANRNLTDSTSIYAQSYKDFMVDGRAVIQYLCKQGVKYKNIILYGRDFNSYWGILLVKEYTDQNKNISIFFRKMELNRWQAFSVYYFFAFHNINNVYKNIPEKSKAYTLEDLRRAKADLSGSEHNYQAPEGVEHYYVTSGGGGVRMGGKHMRNKAKAAKTKSNALKQAAILKTKNSKTKIKTKRK